MNDRVATLGLPILLLIALLALLAAVWVLWRLWQQLNRLRAERGVEHNYLMPGQFMVLAEHPSDASTRLGSDAIGRAVLRQIARTQLRDYGERVVPGRVDTFAAGGRRFSLVTIESPKLESTQELRERIAAINAEFGEGERTTPDKRGDYSTKNGTGTGGGDAGRGLTSEEGGAGGDADEEIAIPRGAAPNWLASGAGRNNGTGGPGARPLPFRPGTPAEKQAEGRPFWEFGLPGIPFPSRRRGEPQPVDIYILDTAPCEVDIDQAMRRWVDGSAEPHPILERLFGPGGALCEADGTRRITYAGRSHLLGEIDFFPPRHNYVMSDHGLFVAGIINAIAPAARLHLIEVLNPYGVGSTASIVHGFALAARAVRPESRLLVNASLLLDVIQLDDGWFERLVETDPFWRQFSKRELEQSVDPMRQVCALFRQAPGAGQQFPYVGVIAAAGNDAWFDESRGQLMHPPARFPAAFQGVVGVGALNHDNLTPAEYTNIADLQAPEAVRVFGGDRAGLYADAENGIIGPYIGTFPDGSANESGWARWAGTSFATPIVTGVMAALIGEGLTFDEAFERIRDAFPEPPVVEPVEQGEMVPVTTNT